MQSHANDVIFTKAGLQQFIKEIRQNPEMVYKIKVATPEEIAANNQIHTTLADGYIPGKGITIIWANGDQISVPVGSDVKAPSNETNPTANEIKNNNFYNNGTVTFIVDESPITIPVKGIIPVLTSLSDETTIPNSGAVIRLVNNLRTQILDLLDGENNLKNGFIPGHYIDKVPNLTEIQIENLETKLRELGIENIPGAMANGSLIISEGVAQADIINTYLEDKKDNEYQLIIDNYEHLYQSMAPFLFELDVLGEEGGELEILQGDVSTKEQELQDAQDILNEKIVQLTINIANIEQIASIGSVLNFTNMSQELHSLFDVDNQDVINLYDNRVNSLINKIQNLKNLSSVNSYSEKLFDATKKDVERNTNYIANISNAAQTLQLSANSINSIFNNTDSEYQEEHQDVIDILNSLFEQLSSKTEEVLSNQSEAFDARNDKDQAENELNQLVNQLEPLLERRNGLANSIEEIQQSLQNEAENYSNAKTSTQLIFSIQHDLLGDEKRIWNVIESKYSTDQASLQAYKIYGAVFNDYAEYRKCGDIDSGRVVTEVGDGSLKLSTARLQLGSNIISDTFGFSIGKTEEAKTPIAVCGRVLAYPADDIALYTPGAAVCSAPGGKISVMTREEIREWPDAIIGYVSEIPNYDYWGDDNIKVDGRIWIKVK